MCKQLGGLLTQGTILHFLAASSRFCTGQRLNHQSENSAVLLTDRPMLQLLQFIILERSVKMIAITMHRNSKATVENSAVTYY